MSELVLLTTEAGVGSLSELPLSISVEEATLVAGVLHGLVHDECLRIREALEMVRDPNKRTEEQLRDDTRTKGQVRDTICQSVEDTTAVSRYADRVTELIRRAVPDDTELLAIAQRAGITGDPRITIDSSAEHWFIRPKFDVGEVGDIA